MGGGRGRKKKKVTAAVNSDSALIPILYTLQKNPLNINTVLSCLFNFVDYETLKSCRGVSKQWKVICDPLLIKQSSFCFTYCREKSSPTRRIITNHMLKFPVGIKSLFTSMKQEAKFSAFKFEVVCLTIPVMNMYLDRNRNDMTQLEIHHAAPTVFQIERLEEYLLDSYMGPNLTKLIVFNNYTQTTSLLVSLGKLASLPVIELINVTIVVSSDAVIAPEELTLINCKRKVVNKDGMLMGAQISERIDFSLLQKLHLERINSYVDSPAKPIWNFSDFVNIKVLTLKYLRINLNDKISAVRVTLTGNAYKVEGVTVNEFLLNDYISAVQEDKIIFQGTQISLDFKHPLKIGELSIIAKVNGNAGLATLPYFKEVGFSGFSCVALKTCVVVINSVESSVGQNVWTCYTENETFDKIFNNTQLSGRIDLHGLHTLHLQGTSETNAISPTNPIWNLSDFNRINSLTLINVNINLDDMIYATELVLSRNTYRKNLVPVDEFLLNDYVPSRSVYGKLILHDKEISLDFSRCMCIEELMIVGKIINSPGRFGLKVKHLGVGGKFVRLTQLPKSIKSLYLFTTYVLCPELKIFPKLSHLILQASRLIEVLSHFKFCPKLTNVELYEYECSYLDVSYLPNLDRVFLRNCNGVRVLNGKLERHTALRELAALVISRGSDCQSILEAQISKFEIDLKLVVFYDFHQIHCSPYNETDVLKFLNIKQKMQLEKIAFGPVTWNSDASFGMSPLSNFVNQKGEYYLLVGDTGKVITREMCVEMIQYKGLEMFKYPVPPGTIVNDNT